MQAHSQEGQTARSPRLLLEAVSGGAWTRGAFARSASQGATGHGRHSLSKDMRRVPSGNSLPSAHSGKDAAQW